MNNKTNYKKWAFKLLIYFIVINAAIAYLVYNYAIGFHNMRKFTNNFNILLIASNVFLIVGTVLTILSVKNKETKNYQYYSSTIGYSIFIALTLIFII